jgi:hypothetical protein
MRCPDCSKFVSLEFQEPEPEEMDLDYDYDKGGPDQEHVTFTVTVDVRLVRNCADCGQELKEGTLTLEGSDVLGHEMKPDCELTAEMDTTNQIEEGGGRYKKSYFGAEVEYVIRCSCQKEKDPPLYTGSVSDKMAASEMDELV